MPRIDELLEQVDSRYALVHAVAKRARQLNDYRHQAHAGMDGENGDLFSSSPPPLVDSESSNDLTVASEEIAAGKLEIKLGKSVERDQATRLEQPKSFDIDLEEE